MKLSIALLALVISSLSLGLQLKGQKPLPPLEKFMVPARLTELNHRMERADMLMIRNSIVMRNGIGVPFVREITDDYEHIVVRALVSEKDLPKTYDERKEALMDTVALSITLVASEFDLESRTVTKVVSVQFVSTSATIRELNAGKTFAEYKGGELTFH